MGFPAEITMQKIQMRQAWCGQILSAGAFLLLLCMCIFVFTSYFHKRSKLRGRPYIICPLIGHKFLILLSKKTTKRGEGGQNFADFETTQFMDGPLRGYYLTTLATFWLFDHLPPLPYVEIFYLIFTNKSTFFNYLPTSSCQRSKKMDLQIKIWILVKKLLQQIVNALRRAAIRWKKTEQ